MTERTLSDRARTLTLLLVGSGMLAWRGSDRVPDARGAQSSSEPRTGAPPASADTSHPYRVRAPAHSNELGPASAAAGAPGSAGLGAGGASGGAGYMMPRQPDVETLPRGGSSRGTLGPPARRRQDVVADEPPPPPAATSPIVVEFTLVRARGAVSSDAVQAVMRSHEAAVGQCYLDGLMRDPSAQGMLLVRLRWSPAGRSLETRVVADYVQNASVVDCVTRQMSGLTVRPFAGTNPAEATVRIHLERHTT